MGLVILSFFMGWTGVSSSSDITMTASSSLSSSEVAMTSSGWTIVDLCPRWERETDSEELVVVLVALPEKPEGVDSGSNRDDSLGEREGAIGVKRKPSGVELDEVIDDQHDAARRARALEFKGTRSRGRDNSC